MADLRLGIIVSTTDKATAKLRGIGGTVAKEARGMGAAFMQAGKAGDAARRKMVAFGSAATQAGAAMSVAGAAITAAIALSVKAAMTQENVEKRLTVIYGKGSDELIKYAAALQKQTRFGDEAIIGAMAFGATFPKLKSHMKEATVTALNMAEAYDMDLNQAMLLIGKAASGQAGALSRYGIGIDTVRAKAEGLPYILKAIGVETADAAFKVKSASVSWDQFKNAVGDVQEQVGNALIPAIKAITPALVSMAEVLGKIAGTPTGNALVIATAALGAFLVTAGPALVILGQLANIMVAVGSASAVFGGPAGLGAVVSGLLGTGGSAGLAAKGVRGLGMVMTTSIGPILAVVAALAIMAWSLKRTADMYNKAADAADDAKKSFEAAGEAERKAGELGFADKAIVARKQREVENAKVTMGDRWRATWKPNWTAQQEASARERIGQSSAIYETMQGGESARQRQIAAARSSRTAYRGSPSAEYRSAQRSAQRRGPERATQVNVYIGDKPLDEKIYEVQEQTSRGAAATAGAY